MSNGDTVSEVLPALRARVAEIADSAREEHDKVQTLGADLRIDLHSLQHNCAEHPMLHRRCGEAEVAIQQAADRLAAMDVRVRAERELIIRASDPKSFNLPKYTESTVSALVELDPTVEVVSDARARVGAILADVKHMRYSVEQRRDMLKLIVTLFNADYFSSDGAVQPPTGVVEARMTEELRKKREQQRREFRRGEKEAAGSK